MQLFPVSIAAAAVIVLVAGTIANREVSRSLHAQSDAQLRTVAQQYAALTRIVASGSPAVSLDAPADSALRATLEGVFSTSAAPAITVELCDSAGRLLLPAPAVGEADRQAFARAARLPRNTAFSFSTSQGPERGATADANLGRWVVLAHETVADADATYDRVRKGLLVLAVLLFVIMAGAGFAVDRVVNRRIRRPAMQLATLAEAVADGNLTVRVPPMESTDEIERLSLALVTMLTELRRLANALLRSSGETATMSAEITASSEEMSASAAEIAQTASDLSSQSATMAQSIQSLAAAATDLTPLAERIDAGAQEGLERNQRLRELALENRRLMDDSTGALAELGTDVDAAAAAVRNLVEASQEIRSFVALVQSLARNSKLLALNAAMEAARAGDQGEGFSVVAAEVRRLSAMSSQAAQRTQQVVAGVLAGVEKSSEYMERMANTARQVRRATEQGSASFTQLEASVAELESWTTSIESAATATNALVGEMTGRLDTIAKGTEVFAAAMQQVAAASEQQSASTEQIAAAAATMAHAAERLSSLVSNLRVDAPRSKDRPAGGAPEPPRDAPASAPVSAAD